eukprot:7699187-Pyramimonas_sp.AAC.1
MKRSGGGSGKREDAERSILTPPAAGCVASRRPTPPQLCTYVQLGGAERTPSRCGAIDRINP